MPVSHMNSLPVSESEEPKRSTKKKTAVLITDLKNH